jgi:hypothetical protein
MRQGKRTEKIEMKGGKAGEGTVVPNPRERETTAADDTWERAGPVPGLERSIWVHVRVNGAEWFSA